MGAYRSLGELLYMSMMEGVPYGGVHTAWTMGYLLTGQLIILRYGGVVVVENLHFSKCVFHNDLRFGTHQPDPGREKYVVCQVSNLS